MLDVQCSLFINTLFFIISHLLFHSFCNTTYCTMIGGLDPYFVFLSFLFYALSPGVADAKIPSGSALVSSAFLWAGCVFTSSPGV